MPQTACPTIATATSLSPCSSPAPTVVAASGAAPWANSTRVARGGDGEAGPGGESAQVAGAPQPDREAGLAGGGTGEELRETDQVGRRARSSSQRRQSTNSARK